jgi:hypothetical protein
VGVIGKFRTVLETTTAELKIVSVWNFVHFWYENPSGFVFSSGSHFEASLTSKTDKSHPPTLYSRHIFIDAGAFDSLNN